MASYPESLFPQIAHQQKRAFLAAFAHTGRIRRAAESSQVNWRNHYNWLAADAAYVEAFAEATRMAGDFLEDEAIRRAMEGVLKPIFYKGEHVDNETVYSDTLLIAALKGAKPEKYRENAHLKVEGDITLHLEERTRQANDRILRLRRGSSNALAS